MSIVKFSSIVLLFISQSSFAVTADDCASLLVNKERTLKYFACLQENLADAEIKAKIKEAESRGKDKSVPSYDSMPPPIFNAPVMSGADLNADINEVNNKIGSEADELPQYIAYSASKTSKEAVIAYGKSEVRVKKGSVLSGGWTVSEFNEYSMSVTKKNKKKTIPLTIVSGDTTTW